MNRSLFCLYLVLFMDNTFSSRLVRYRCFVTRLCRLVQTHRVEVILVKFRDKNHLVRFRKRPDICFEKGREVRSPGRKLHV